MGALPHTCTCVALFLRFLLGRQQALEHVQLPNCEMEQTAQLFRASVLPVPVSTCIDIPPAHSPIGHQLIMITQPR